MMQKHERITLERLDKYTSKAQFSDVNLMSTLWKEVYPITEIKYFHTMDRIPFDMATRQTFTETNAKDLVMTPSWSTFWIHLNFSIPSNFQEILSLSNNDDYSIVLYFDPNCEALIFDTKGNPIQGITGGKGWDQHIDIPLTNKPHNNGNFEFYIEVACNGMFGNPGAEAGIITAPDPNKTFRISTLDVRIVDNQAQHLLWDFEIIRGLAKHLNSEGSQLKSDALYIANTIVNTVKPDNRETILQARKISSQFFKDRHIKETCASDHVITATGHCHIDTAWLWAYDETKRKCARSWSTQCELMDLYPEYNFSCSQAQQYEWMQELYPKLFERIKAKVKTGNFIPVGGTWVEMDCNIPSGESFCRQFFYGQRYFESTFGSRHKVFWLPDTFGYSAQLPQIIKESALEYFFTQKLSWNNINKFPHSTFWWKGLDGTKVLTHFCPADTYCAQANVQEVVKSVTNNKDKEYTNQSLLLFGNGDGGGGPLIPMIERLRRLESISGLPAKVKFGTPDQFYKDLHSKSRHDIVTWKGELYFELHRGTYTSQAATKYYNRKLEYLFRSIEYFGVLCRLYDTTSSFVYQQEQVDRLWKLILLNQFHDVLPGSSINIVYTDALKFYLEVEEKGNQILNSQLEFLKSNCGDNNDSFTIVNETSWKLDPFVVQVDSATLNSNNALQTSALDSEKSLIIVPETSSFSSCSGFNPDLQQDYQPVTTVENGSTTTSVNNQFITATFDKFGRLVELYDKVEGRQVIDTTSKGANAFKMYEDIPLYWDAWDVEVYHLEKCWYVGYDDDKQKPLVIKENGPLRVVLECQLSLSATTTVKQHIIITATSPLVTFDTIVDWNENRKMLKVEFPVDIMCDYASYESQYGIVQRPTHYNNSWDMARFEVCGHKFVDFSEHGYGVSILNDCKYGHAVKDNVITTSLLASPKAPDESCDIGQHKFKYAIYPHKGTIHESDVVKVAYQFNVEPRVLPFGLSKSIGKPLFGFDCNHVVLDTIKLAHDRSDTPKRETTVVIRLYESIGGRANIKIKSGLKMKRVFKCNILEDVGQEIQFDDGECDSFHCLFTPFQLVSLLVTF